MPIASTPTYRQEINDWPLANQAQCLHTEWGWCTHRTTAK